MRRDGRARWSCAGKREMLGLDDDVKGVKPSEGGEGSGEEELE